LDRSDERSSKLKEHFKDNYDNFLHQKLSSTLLNSKEKLLDLKNRLIRDLKKSLFELIRTRIEENYPSYIEFLLKNIKEIKESIDKPHEIELILNDQDYKYLMKNYGKIQDLFTNPVEINKNAINFIGGFKISLIGGSISYDYTIDNLINMKSSFIQMEISKIFNDDEIKQIEANFNSFIQNKKTKITVHVKQYDQIQV
jgi:vacuolar-type H+-ATPase subunit E/Vma4